MSKHKHHIIPRYKCKELGIDPDFSENIVEVTRLDHALIHWGYKCDDLEPLFKYVTPKQWIIDLIPRGDSRDVGAAVILSEGEMDGVDISGENNPHWKGGITYDIKAYKKVYNQTPERKAYDKKFRQTPERKAYMKEYNKKFRQTPEYKEYDKKRNATPERKAHMKEYKKVYNQTPEYKEYDKKRNATPERKAWKKAYSAERYAKKRAETQGEGTLVAHMK